MYRAWVANQIDAESLRAASLGLTRIANLDQGQALEARVCALEGIVADRLTGLEERVASAERRGNGHAHP